MVESTPNRPIPEGELKQNAPEAGAGPLGIPPPTTEHSSQGGGSTSPERLPPPSVLDILERRAQLQEDRKRVSQQLGPKVTRARRAMLVEYNAKEIVLGRELKAVHDLGTDRDRLIIDVYTTMNKFESGEPAPWSRDFVFPERIRQFISRVAPMSNEEIAEELRKAQEALDRKTQANKKRSETKIRQKGLTWEERHEKLLEAGRQRYYKRKE